MNLSIDLYADFIDQNLIFGNLSSTCVKFKDWYVDC